MLNHFAFIFYDLIYFFVFKPSLELKKKNLNFYFSTAGTAEKKTLNALLSPLVVTVAVGE